MQNGKEDFFMKRNTVMYIFYGVILLAVFGLLAQLFGNTRNFIMSVFMMLGFAVAIFALFYFLINRSRDSSDEMKKYKRVQVAVQY
jgi:polyferredoxin